MGLTIPQPLQIVLAEADNATQPLNELELAAKLMAALGDNAATLKDDEKRGAFAEIESLRFQRPLGTEKGPWGIYWGPLGSATTTEGKELHFPDIAHVGEDILLHWITRSATAKHPMLRARFADLTWEIGRLLKKRSEAGATTTTRSISIDITVVLAQRAIDGYLETVERELAEDEYHAWQLLERAIGLGAAINDPSRMKRAKDAIFRFCRAAEGGGGKFLWWRFDDLTWNHARTLDLSAQEMQEIIDVLERALARHSDRSDKELFDPHWALDAADRLARRRAQTQEPDEAKRAMKTAAAVFEELAQDAGALVAISWLEGLIPRYRNAGMMEDAVRLEQTIRRRADEAKGEMKRIEVPLNIPKKELEQWADNVAGSTLDDALGRIAQACLIREDSTKASIKNLTKNAPLLAMMPSSIMGDDGFTTAKIGSIDDDLEGRAIQHAADRFNWYAPWLYFAINRIKAKHGIEIAGLMAFLAQSPLFPQDREPLVREGLTAWLAEDAVKAIHVLVPQVEAALRDLLAALQTSVIKPNPKTGGFEVIGLGEILSHQAFRLRVPKDIRFHLRALLSDPRGINLRNHLAHGLARPELLGMGTANWVVHALLVVGSLRLKQAAVKT